MSQSRRTYVIIRIYLLLLGFLLTTLSCASGPVSGILYSKTSFPGTINPDSSVRRELRAEGCVHNFLTLFSVGNAGAGEIAFKNGISRVSLIDHSSLQILTLLYRNYCTIVIGEKG
ncbi:TRL-like family protein [Leptospira fainei serovar Hurstbridge str. BUT 6]|uniref:TRL-like family protein n=1 Tax=Leptospira fainei serovar Hurstbridge str. BUT 6 TaxID=1193011 RepID=S3UZV0_9LEPT|nr:TRL-like family protein [Leptospira fainei]EPG74753.1 TRL-like family protein [Leptospira fainei serovar Hurstbridge str. BUT 6]